MGCADGGADAVAAGGGGVGGADEEGFAGAKGSIPGTGKRSESAGEPAPGEGAGSNGRSEGDRGAGAFDGAVGCASGVDCAGGGCSAAGASASAAGGGAAVDAVEGAAESDEGSCGAPGRGRGGAYPGVGMSAASTQRERAATTANAVAIAKKRGRRDESARPAFAPSLPAGAEDDVALPGGPSRGVVRDASSGSSGSAAPPARSRGDLLRPWRSPMPFVRTSGLVYLRFKRGKDFFSGAPAGRSKASAHGIA